MLPWTRRLARWAAAVGCLACAVIMVPTADAAPDEVDDRIGTYLRAYQRSAHIPGLAFAIVRDDRVQRQELWGVDGNGAAVTERTPFLLGSVSKPVTALAVMQLVEAGRVALDAPVIRYLPRFRLADAAASRRITVRHLLTHDSGIPDRAVRTDRFDNAAGGLTRAVRELARVRPIREPGDGYEYSDANYLLLGAIVEAVTGQSFGAYLRGHVLDPLGMRDSAATAAEAGAVGLPAGNRYYLGHPRRFDSPYDTSGVPYGYLAASLRDLTHLVAAELNGGRYGDTRILSAAGIEQTHTGDVAVGATGRYGLGWRDTELDSTGTRIVWHAGATPGYFSHLILVPDAGVGVIVLANVYSPAMDPVLTAAAFNVVRIMQGEAPLAAAPESAFQAATYGLLATIGLLLAALVWSVIRLVGAPRRRGVASRARIVAAAGCWLAGCLTVAVAAMWALPVAMGADLRQALLWTPDAGQALVAVTVLAAAVALVRLAATGYALAGTRRMPAGIPQHPVDDAQAIDPLPARAARGGSDHGMRG